MQHDRRIDLQRSGSDEIVSYLLDSPVGSSGELVFTPVGNHNFAPHKIFLFDLDTNQPSGHTVYNGTDTVLVKIRRTQKSSSDDFVILELEENNSFWLAEIKKTWIH
jgi:hypothetical protein